MAVARVEAADGAQDVHPLVPEPQQVPEHGHGGRPRRQAALGVSANVGVEEGEEEEEESDEERPRELHLW